MLSVAVGVATMCTLIAIPGVLLGRWSDRRPSFNLAVVVATGLGWNLVIGQLLDAVGAPYTVWTLGAIDVGLSIGVLWSRRHRRDRAPSGTTPGFRSDHLLLMFAIGAATLFWLVTLRHHPVMPPYQDGLNHGFMTKQVSALHTVSPERVASLSADGLTPGSGYYPLGMHATLGIAASVSGAGIDVLLVATSVIAAAVLLPISVFQFVRSLDLEFRLAAGISALMSVSVVSFPYRTYAWAGLALILGNALAPGIAAACIETATGRPRRPTAVTTGLALTGLFAVHNSAWIVALLLVLAAGTAPIIRTLRGPERRAAIRATALTLGVHLITLVPSAADVLRGQKEREAIVVASLGSTGAVLRSVVSGSLDLPDRQVLWMAMAVAGGIAIACLRRRHLGLVLVGGLVALLTVATGAHPDSVVADLAMPWYRQAGRVTYVLALFGAICGGLGLAVALGKLTARLPEHRRWSTLGPIVVTGLVGVIWWQQAHPAATMIDDALQRGAIVDNGVRDAFAHVALVNPVGATVLGDICDQSTWMWALDGVPPLLGVTPASPKGNTPTARRRVLMTHLNAGVLDGDDRALLRDLDARFLFVGERSICAEGRLIDPVAIQSNPLVELDYRNRSAAIYRLKVDSNG